VAAAGAGAIGEAEIAVPDRSGPTIGAPGGTGGPNGRGRRIGGNASVGMPAATSEARRMPPLVSSDDPRVDVEAARLVGACSDATAGDWVVSVATGVDSPTSAGVLAGASWPIAGVTGSDSSDGSSTTLIASALGFFALQL
jgi:hypothetical protein